MTRQIRNPQELQEEMFRLAEKALQGATEEVLEIFKNDYIMKIVYIDNPQKYERTMDFLNAWDWTPIKRELMSLTTELWYNPGKMSHNIEKFQHGSIYSTPPVVIDNLMHILNKVGYSSSLWISVYRSKAYWDEFVSDMIERGALMRIIEKYFLSLGFTRGG